VIQKADKQARAKAGGAADDEPDDEIGEEFVAGKAWDGQLVRRLVGEARPHANLFYGAFAILFALFVLELAGPGIIRGAIDGPVAAALEAREGDAAGYDATPFRADLWLWAGLYLVCALFTMGLRYLETSHLGRTGQIVIAELRTKVFRHLQRLDLTWFDKRPTGALVTRVTTDIENLNEMFTSGIVVLLFDLVRIVGLLAVLFVLDWRLALVVLAGLPLLIGVSLVFRGGARNAHRVVRARLATMNGYLQEVLNGIRVVQVFRREERVSGRFKGLLDRYLVANFRTILLFALFFPILDVVVNGIQASTVWVGGIDISRGDLTPGKFFQFWFYVLMLLNPVRELGERYNVLQSAFASAERIFQVLDTRPEIYTAPGATRLGARFRGHVRFEHVSFEYVPGVKVLDDVSFEIPAGSSVAVVGATGAGKSTLVNLLLRYYDPSAGRITLDGVDLRELDLAELRERTGLVLQEDFLFAGSLRDNLVMERAEVTDASLEDALVASRAEDVVAGLTGGLSAPVAERGATLSTGQRQLLSIARALAGSPQLVILDEATASVDSATEAEIEKAKRNLLTNRTALVIAHRLSTVRSADHILVMHRGELREEGTHAELMAASGIYAKLHAMQFAPPTAS
jgi:ATP-binding cassette subfamily B protein